MKMQKLINWSADGLELAGKIVALVMLSPFFLIGFIVHAISYACWGIGQFFQWLWKFLHADDMN